MFKYICRREGKKGIMEKVSVCFVILLLEKIEDWIICFFFLAFSGISASCADRRICPYFHR